MSDKHAPTTSSIPEAASRPTDLQDERLRDDSGIAGAIRASLDRVRSGDLGLLPVLVGLVVISTIFQLLNSTFLSPANLSNLLMESAAVGVIALGIVFVLLVGQIDLSVGSVSGFASAVLAVTFVSHKWPLAAAITAAILLGLAIGWVYGQIFNRVGIPSFVITLAGLLAFLGLQLLVLGPTGTINLPFNSAIVEFGQLDFVPAPLSYLIVALVAIGLFAVRFFGARNRTRAGLSAPSITSNIVTALALGVVLAFAAWYLDQDRGIGWMFILLVALVFVAHYALTQTSWGRAVFAVGGNQEAARRAGINVKAIYTSTFVICSTLGAVGGILAAARLASAAQSSGAGDTNLNAIAAAVIGGTSLFGGRGTAFSALLGILVIQSISSGLTLLNLDSSIRFIITGIVVLIAVGVDALARQSRASHGRA